MLAAVKTFLFTSASFSGSLCLEEIAKKPGSKCREPGLLHGVETHGASGVGKAELRGNRNLINGEALG